MIDILDFLTPSTITLVGLLVIWVIQLLAKKFLSKTDIETLIAISAIAVESVEQLAKIGRLRKEERHKAALELVISELNRRGIHISLELITSAIESAVLQVNAFKPIELEPIELEKEGG